MFIMASYFNEDILGKGITLIPGTYLFKNLKIILEGNYVQSYLNSIVVSVISTICSVLICAAAGYGLSLYQFKGRKLLRNIIILTMLLPPQIGIIGYIIEMRALGISRTFLPLIISWLPNSFGCFWITQYLDANIQKEIVESARIDGANEVYTFFSISLPLMRAAIITLVTLTFLWSWNSYMLPLIIISKASMYTIPLYVMSINGLFRTDYSLQITALFFATIPLLFIYILGGKYFQKGLIAGAIKG
jgi:multiple sugar transport system permease protein/cellobiose transport system permease protein